MFEQPLDDAGDDLSAAAVVTLRSTAAVRASADAVELHAIATLVQVRRGQARLEAQRLAAVRRRQRPGTPAREVRVDLEAVDRCTAQEVSLALWLSPVVARARAELALELVEGRPATFDALVTGSIDLVRARRILDAVRTLGSESLPDAAGADAAPVADAASAVEAEALYPGSVPLLADLRPGRPAAELTPAQLTARLNRLVMRAAPASAVRRTALADERRGCSLRVLPDGMALLSVTGRMELLGAAFGRVDATARALVAADTVPTASTGHPARDASRTLDQARVDAVLTALLGHSDDLGQAPGIQVTLALVAPAGTVLAGGDEPGELLGLGPVPAPMVRALAVDAAWVRWSSDPGTGQVNAVGRRRYRPTAAVADLVRARDGHCRFPTCRRRAGGCDLDHVTPFPGGATEPDNLTALCRTHHLTKHRGGFRLRIDPDGTASWTTPTGRQVPDPPQTWGTRTRHAAGDPGGPRGPSPTRPTPTRPTPASPTMSGPTLPSPTMSGPTLPSPTMSGPTLPSPTMAGPTMAGPDPPPF